MRGKPQIDNEIYKRLGHIWWDEELCRDLNLLRFGMNPVRTAYFHSVIGGLRAGGGTWRKVVDVGCGGGYLSEEFAKAGFDTTGIDPAEESLVCARRHAAEAGLRVAYVPGSGERIPFEDASFDIALCCDVLEHVDSVDCVLGEIARVLRPGGIFFYDTVNRTLASWLAVIKVMQDWFPSELGTGNLHVWHKFIKPRELVAAMKNSGLDNRDIRGIAPSHGVLASLVDIYRFTKGRLSYRQLVDRMKVSESGSVAVAYMGYAVRTN